MNTLVQCETRMRTTVGCRVLVARAEHGTDFHHFGPRTRTLATVHCSRRGRGGLDGFCGSDLTMPKYLQIHRNTLGQHLLQLETWSSL
jgi:hypothetical protein